MMMFWNMCSKIIVPIFFLLPFWLFNAASRYLTLLRFTLQTTKLFCKCNNLGAQPWKVYVQNGGYMIMQAENPVAAYFHSDSFMTVERTNRHTYSLVCLIGCLTLPVLCCIIIDHPPVFPQACQLCSILLWPSLSSWSRDWWTWTTREQCYLCCWEYQLMCK